jgi:hypothetical protein
MANSDKRKLFETFEKVNKVNLKEWMDEKQEFNSDWSFKTPSTNKELRAFIAELLWKLKYYEQSVAVDIITSALEDKYPQLKQV